MNIQSNRLFSYWKIGKNVYEKQKKYDDIIRKTSIFYSYKYGLSHSFSLENIKYMKLFYLCFPNFYSNMDKLSWEHYKKLINIDNRDKRNFYFKVCLLCSFNYDNLVFSLDNNLYEYIKKDNNYS